MPGGGGVTKKKSRSKKGSKASKSSQPSITEATDDSKSSDVSMASSTSSSTSVRRAGRRPSGEHIADRLWERDELHDVNSRLANLLENYNPETDLGVRLTRDDIRELKGIHDSQLKDAEDAFKDKLQQKNGEIQSLNRMLNQLRDDLDNEKERANDNARKLSKLGPELEKCKRERDEERAAKEKAEHDAEADRTTLKGRNERLSDDNDKLNDRVTELEDLLGAKETELESKFSARLQDELANREKKWAHDKADLKDVLEERFNDVKASLQNRIDDLEGQLEVKDENIKDLQSELTGVCAERDALQRKFDEERRQREMANKELRMAKQAHSRELDNQRKDYQKLEDAYNVACDQMFATQNLNNDLRVEIDELMLKCDAFEDKMGIVSPLRQRKRLRRDPSTLSAVKIDSVNSDEVKARGSFPLENIKRRFMGDWNGFELENQWTVPVILEGMVLTNNVPGTVDLVLPSVVIHPQGIIRVCLTDVRKHETDLIWTGIQVDKQKVQELWIKDAAGDTRLIDQVPAKQITTEESTCRVM